MSVLEVDQLSSSLACTELVLEKACDVIDACRAAVGEKAERAASDLDHYGCHHAPWYRAVKKARAALNKWDKREAIASE